MAEKLTITNARVFEGSALTVPRAITIEDGRIAPDGAVGDVFDAGGGTLLPGLLDAHVHVDTESQLEQLAALGVTTVFDMGAPHTEVIQQLREATVGRPAVLFAGYPASARKSVQTSKMGYPPESVVTGPTDAARFVAGRVAQGVDYIKVILDQKIPFGPKPLSQVTVEAIAREAHRAGLKVVVHVTSVDAFRAAADAGADLLTHAPLGGTLTDEFARSLADRGIAVAPTLTMMKGLAENWPFRFKPRSIAYANARDSVSALYRAGVTILAGTDANADPNSPARITHGNSLHDELALLVDAGVSPTDALRAATSTAATYFGLTDRGEIGIGRRADLVLVDGDPTEDITATKAISAVWVGGTRVR